MNVDDMNIAMLNRARENDPDYDDTYNTCSMCGCPIEEGFELCADCEDEQYED